MERDDLLKVSKHTKNTEDYRRYKNKRNEVNKLIKIEKFKYYNNILGYNINDNMSQDTENEDKIDTSHKKSSNLWKLVTDRTKKFKGGTPQYITQNNVNYSKPIEIAQIASAFFIDKIIKIQNKFKPSICNPLVILNYLIPRNDKLFELPLFTIKDTKKYI